MATQSSPNKKPHKQVDRIIDDIFKRDMSVRAADETRRRTEACQMILWHRLALVVPLEMAINLTLIIVIIWSNIWTVGYSSSTQNSQNSLNGQHLRVIWPLWSGNPKGLPGPLKGGVVLDYLASRLNFTYEMVRVTENRLEPVGKEIRGLFSYLWDQQSDLLIQDVVQTYERQKFIDMTVPWIFGSFALLMPVQDDTANVNAVIKPFQWPVWLGLAISIVCVIFVLNLLQRYFTHRSLCETTPIEIRNQNYPIIKTGNQYLYVLGNLLSQGAPSPSKRLSFRLVAAVWSLAAFIFVQAYTSTLFTYVVTPVNPPLVKSALDLVEKTDINVLVRKGGVIDTMFSNVENSKILGRTLRDRMNSFSQSRCSLASECINLLTPGSRNIFIDGTAYLMDAIREDFNKTRKCNLQLAKDSINGNSVQISLIALQKNSKFTKTISKAMLELMQTGIVDHWELWFRPMPLQCLSNFKSVYKPKNSKQVKMKSQPPALSLKNLTGAFIILIFGFSVSLLAFLGEQIVSIPGRHRQRLERARNKILKKSSEMANKKKETDVENQSTLK